MYLRVVSPQDIANVAERWKRQYCKDGWTSDRDNEIYVRLKALPPTATKDDVRDILGNDSWVGFSCVECPMVTPRHQIVVALGEPEDLNDQTAYLCLPCITRLGIYVRGVKEAMQLV